MSDMATPNHRNVSSASTASRPRYREGLTYEHVLALANLKAILALQLPLQSFLLRPTVALLTDPHCTPHLGESGRTPS